MISRKFKKQILIGLVIALFGWMFASTSGFSLTVQELDHRIKNDDTTFFREFFENIIYKPFVRVLRFDRIPRDVKLPEAKDINAFDEVPDSSFFVNRNGKNQMSKAELLKASEKGNGPDPAGPWTITKGKMEGVSIGIFIRDSKEDRYILKFDPKDYPEMTSSAEIIAHKFFHAFGYNVAEYYLVSFNPSIFKIDPKATYYNEDGFKKPLTQEALANFLERIPKQKGGTVRASASKILKYVQGNMVFEGRRKKDPEDLILHENRRSIRGLRVFGSWMNHYDLREGNTLDVIEEDENGNAHIKHYLIDFGSTLGSASFRPKVPVAGYEHIVDWAEVGKTAPALKIVEKPWEKRWDAMNRQISSPAIGYFDNTLFKPAEWKTQLPYDTFYRLTKSDAFWATKIIMSFSDEDIRAIVDSGEYSDPEDTKAISNTLIERRNIIGRYWFSEVTPLDQIKLVDRGSRNFELQFEDLNLKYGFQPKDAAIYRSKLETVDGKGKKNSRDYAESATHISFAIPSKDIKKVTVWIQAKYGQDSKWTHPPLRVVLAKAKEGDTYTIVEIDHGV